MHSMKRHSVRVMFRLLGFGLIAVVSLIDFVLRIWLSGKASSVRARADWLQRWCRWHLRNLRVRVHREGAMPKHGVLVSNHLSYVDVLVLGAAQPLAFVSKSEVRSWPLIGWLTRCGGTLFIDREKRSDVTRVGTQFAPVIAEGLVIALFPEGTSTDGHTVLPFRASLFAPATEYGWPVVAAWIGYSLADGSVEEEVCYWGDMTFGPHFLNLLSKEQIQARVVYSPPISPGRDRKELARLLQGRVWELAELSGRRLQRLDDNKKSPVDERLSG